MLVFLFTDLEASTRMWEQYPGQMGPALARHDDILRRSVVENGGTVVKATGDGLMATFSRMSDAVAACAEAQLALAAADWETPEPLRVRMGVHVGDAEPRAGDHYGTAVNRAARIMAVGHGGQVLLSSIASELVIASPIDGVELRDLGPHRLKDLTEPERLFQVLHAGLRADFPPLASLGSRPNNLPVQVSEFFGRDAQLKSVRSMLATPGSRLVTLTGPGGTGKTRLALQVAADLLNGYPDGVYFVDLSAALLPDAVFEAILRDLELSGTSDGSALQVLKARLRDRRMLIVLDNFEQVTDAGIGVSELLQTCPDIQVLVTSREALRLRGEHVFPVPTLSLPDPAASPTAIAGSEAIQLFMERAQAAQAGLTLTDGNAAAIAEITVRLDGLPLAIELAAARLEVFSVTELRDRLRTRIDVLGTGARDLPDRQRTLRSTIGWSYELLDEDECRIFELMAVFSTARLNAIEAVSADAHGEIDVIDVLASLVAKSLVQITEVEGSRRFGMLQSIREYAAERLAAQPEIEARVQLAHARYVTDYASGVRPELAGTGREAALIDLSTEVGNLRAAWRYWAESGNIEQLHLILDGLWAVTEARGWYHAAVELTTDMLSVLSTSPPSPERDVEEMELRMSLARSLMAVRGFTVEVEEEFKRALTLSGRMEESARRAPVLRALAFYYMTVANMEECVTIGRELLTLGERQAEPSIIVEGHLVLGVSTAVTGRLMEGLDHLDRAIALFDPAAHPSTRLRVGTSPGVVARSASALLLRQAGLPQKSAARSNDALRLARESEHPFSLAYALYHTGYHALLRQDFETALERAQEMDVIARQNGYAVWGALASILHGVADCGLGRFEEGIARSEAGADLYQGLTTPPMFWPPLLAVRASGFALAGQPERALELIDEAIAVLGGNEARYPEFLILRGDLLATIGTEPAVVEESYRAALRGSRVMGSRLTELEALCRLVESTEGETNRALRDEMSAHQATFTEGFDEPELVNARAILELA